MDDDGDRSRNLLRATSRASLEARVAGALGAVAAALGGWGLARVVDLGERLAAVESSGRGVEGRLGRIEDKLDRVAERMNGGTSR